MCEKESGDAGVDPEREATLHIRAWNGLEDGNLAPLAELLRSGFALNEQLALNLADAIEGKSPLCRITAQRARSGRPRSRDQTARNSAIAFFVAVRTKPGQFEAAVSEAMAHFGIERTAVTDAIRAARKYREKFPEKAQGLWEARCKTGREKLPSQSDG